MSHRMRFFCYTKEKHLKQQIQDQQLKKDEKFIYICLFGFLIV
jgi:hypothetical protein